MTLVIIAVPAAMLLAQIEGENRSVWIGDGLFRGEDRLPRLISTARTGIDTPSRLFLAVDGILDRACHSITIRFVIENGVQRLLWESDVGSRSCNLEIGRASCRERW